MRQYSPGLVKVSWAGLSFDDALAVGPFFSIRQNAPTWRNRYNGLGGTVRQFSLDRSGEIDFLINSEDKVHQKLIALAISDRLTRAIKGPLVVRDLNTRETFVFTSAYITTEPDEQRGTTSADVNWTFAYTRLDHVPNLGDHNLVGS